MERDTSTNPESASSERWLPIDEPVDPSYWDLALGGYGDGHMSWLTDVRSIAGTRLAWDKRARYAPELLFAEMNFNDAGRDASSSAT